jgi:phosphoserine phosphatase RsbU/P
MGASPQVKLQQQKLILIVDDTPTNIGAISGALRDSYKTKVATNGAKALAIAAEEEKPDLILLDVMMPEMDGYEVCRRLKADPATSEIPIIFLTGQTSAEDETQGFDVGAVDYVHKPFSPAVVKARVRSHILLREAREQLAQQLLSINNELEMARQIQLSILPHELPKIAGLDIAARYMPMTSVAGDFYDFIIPDDKHLGILIADVAGHGLPSALIASMLQVALSAQVAHASDPAEVLSGLNRSLCGKFQYNFVTAAYTFVDMERQTMNYAGAGHPPLLLLRGSDGKARELMENGLFLGMFPEAEYSAKQLSLEPGDRCVLYTDGIPETKNPSDEEFKTGRFMRSIENNKALGADQFVDAFLGELSRWSEQPLGQGQQDDITLLVVDFKPNRSATI